MAQIKFWEGMTQAASVQPIDKLMVGVNADGSTRYANIQQLLALMQATGATGIRGEATSSTDPGSPSAPELYYAKLDNDASSTTFTNFLDSEGDPIVIPTREGTAPDEQIVVNPILIFDGTSWDAIWQLSDPINLSGYAKKQDVAPLIWGVGDEHDNVGLWLDGNLEFHAKLHPDSWPPPRIPTVPADLLDFGISDPLGNIIFGILKDGSIYPAQSSGSQPPTPTPTVPITTIRAEDITQPSDIVKDGMWNQWIEPYGAVDSDGTLWMASIGFRGNLYVTKRTADGVTQRVLIGNIDQNNTSDDHNCPAILLDDRPGADYPVIVFQADHNTSPMRYWRFGNKDIETWGVVAPQTIGSGLVAYTQVSRNGDEIFVFSRVATGGRPWRCAYSDDNGDTWTVRNLFTRSNSWLYMLFRLKDDGSGLNIAAHDHPLNGTDQDIYMMQLDFTTGAVTAPGEGTVIADIRAAIANSGFTPLDPFAVGTLVYNATGTQVTRLWDISRNATGDVAVAFNVMPSDAASLSNFKASTYNVATVNTSTGAVVISEVIGEAGTPIENPKGSNFYFAGLSLIDNERMFVSKWESNAQRDNTGNMQDDYGMSTVEVVDFSNPSDITRKLVCYSDKKVIRPFAIADFVMMVECNYFIDYFDFYSNVCINNKSIIG